MAVRAETMLYIFEFSMFGVEHSILKRILAAPNMCATCSWKAFGKHESPIHQPAFFLFVLLSFFIPLSLVGAIYFQENRTSKVTRSMRQECIALLHFVRRRHLSTIDFTPGASAVRFPVAFCLWKIRSNKGKQRYPKQKP